VWISDSSSALVTCREVSKANATRTPASADGWYAKLPRGRARKGYARMSIDVQARSSRHAMRRRTGVTPAVRHEPTSVFWCYPYIKVISPRRRIRRNNLEPWSLSAVLQTDISIMIHQAQSLDSQGLPSYRREHDMAATEPRVAWNANLGLAMQATCSKRPDLPTCC
jgi:hypothetical protein